MAGARQECARLRVMAGQDVHLPVIRGQAASSCPLTSTSPPLGPSLASSPHLGALCQPFFLLLSCGIALASQARVLRPMNDSCFSVSMTFLHECVLRTVRPVSLGCSGRWRSALTECPWPLLWAPVLKD